MAKTKYTRPGRVQTPQWTRRAERKLENLGAQIFGGIIAGFVAFLTIACFPIPGALVSGVIIFLLIATHSPKPQFK